MVTDSALMCVLVPYAPPMHSRALATLRQDREFMIDMAQWAKASARIMVVSDCWPTISGSSTGGERFKQGG